ncbi:MAG: RAD55 family ATPase [Euryarchaeota archaeon]|nr:RAD55 family ATPase [Euryarchaeota archaeon]
MSPERPDPKEAARAQPVQRGGPWAPRAEERKRAETAAEPRPFMSQDLVATGIAGLDAQFHGGLPAGNTVLLLSDPSTAPSVFLAQYAAQGLLEGEHIHYFSLERPADDVMSDILNFVQDPDKMQNLHLVDGFPLQFKELPHASRGVLKIDKGEDVLEALENLLVDPDLSPPFRIIVDSFTEMLLSYEPKRVVRTLRLLRGVNRALQASAAVSMIGALHDPGQVATVRHLADGVIEFETHRQGMGLYPVLLITKMRGIPEPQRLLLYKETDKGLWLESTKRVQ